MELELIEILRKAVWCLGVNTRSLVKDQDQFIALLLIQLLVLFHNVWFQFFQCIQTHIVSQIMQPPAPPLSLLDHLCELLSVCVNVYFVDNVRFYKYLYSCSRKPWPGCVFYLFFYARE